MFQRASTQRSQISRNQLQHLKPHQNDENAPASKSFADSTAMLKSTKSLQNTLTANAASTMITRKRRALGDVSNQQPDQVNIKGTAGSKDHKTAISKPVPLVTKAISAQTRKQTITQPLSAVNIDAALPAVQPVVTTRIRQKSQRLAAQDLVKLHKSATVVVETKQKDDIKENVDPNKISLEEDRKRPRTDLVKFQDWDDLDADDIHDPVMVAEYVVEIFEYLRKLEITTMPNPNYMENQKELQWKMRSILIDWLVEVHNRFRLLPETLFLAVNIIDRFLSLRNVSITKLQLVGITAMFIASKYEEVYAPSVNQFIYMADGGYSNEEMLKAERYVLSILNFNLHFPNPLNFLRRCSKADEYDMQTRNFSKYLLEVAMLDEKFLKFPPSLLTAACMYLSRAVLSRGKWHNNLEHYSGYSVDELKDCVRELLHSLSRPRKWNTVYKKYQSIRLSRASLYFEEWIQMHESFHDWNLKWD